MRHPRGLLVLVLLLVGCSSSRSLGIEQRGTEIYFSTSDREQLAEVARQATSRVGAPEVAVLFEEALADVRRREAAGEFPACDLEALNFNRVHWEFDPEPLDTEEILAKQSSMRISGDILEHDVYGDALAHHDLVLRVGIHVAPWPQGEEYTDHPELLLAQAQVLWWSKIGENTADLRLAETLANLGGERMAEVLIETAAEAGLEQRDPSEL